MRGPFLLVVLMGLLPIGIFASIVIVSGLRPILWQPPTVWTTQFGQHAEASGVTALSVDSSGLYVAGYSGYNCGPDPCPLVAKYDLDGHQVWTHTINESYSQLNSIDAIGNGVTVGGVLNGSSSVRWYDSTGGLGWTTPPLRDDEITSVSDGQTEIYSAGLGPLNPQGGVSPFIIHGFSLNGTVLWTQTLGNATSHYISSYATSSGVYVARSDQPNFGNTHAILSKFNLNGAVNWTRQVNDPPSYIACACGISGIAGDATGVYLAGYTAVTQYMLDGFIMKYDSNGNQVWRAQFSSPDSTGVESLAVSADSTGVYLAEKTYDNTFLLKYDLNGGAVWSFEIPNLSYYGYSLGIAAGASGVFVGGDLRVDNNLGGSYTNGYLARFSQSSSLILFGVNPPYSFLLLGGVIAAVTTVILLIRRRTLEKVRLAQRTSRGRNLPPAIKPSD